MNNELWELGVMWWIICYEINETKIKEMFTKCMFRSYNFYRDNIFDKKNSLNLAWRLCLSISSDSSQTDDFKSKLYFTETNWGVTSKLNKVMFLSWKRRGNHPSPQRAYVCDVIVWSCNTGEDGSQCPAASSQANIFISLSLSPSFLFFVGNKRYKMNENMPFTNFVLLDKVLDITYRFDLSTKNLGIGQNQLSVGSDNLHWMF